MGYVLAAILYKIGGVGLFMCLQELREEVSLGILGDTIPYPLIILIALLWPICVAVAIFYNYKDR